MRRSLGSILAAAALSVFTSSSASAASINLFSDPFEGSTALTTPGRQVVGNELFVPVFNILTDEFVLNSLVFGVSSLSFANNTIGNIPTSGVNTIVLRTFDDDGNTSTAFGAGNAANLIAAQLVTPGAGFFIYFNQGLDLPRLVFSTDLNDNTADLKVLARLQNLGGVNGQNQLVNFEADNFRLQAVPEPGTLLLVSSAGAWFLRRRVRRK
jgi:hypothetical protein